MSAPANFPAERIYDYVHAPHKSAVLLDRLWPRGISKAALQGVAWEKTPPPAPNCATGSTKTLKGASTSSASASARNWLPPPPRPPWSACARCPGP